MSLPKEFKELDTPTNRLKKLVKQIYKIIKIVLFVAILISTFMVSEKSTDWILNLSFEQLSKIINVILVVVIVLFLKRKQVN